MKQPATAQKVFDDLLQTADMLDTVLGRNGIEIEVYEKVSDSLNLALGTMLRYCKLAPRRRKARR